MSFSYVNSDGTPLIANTNHGALPSGSDGSAELDPTILTQASAAQLEALKLLADIQPQLTTDGVHLTNGLITTGDQAKINALPVDTTAALSAKSNKPISTSVAAATYTVLETDEVLDVTYTTTGAVTAITLPTAQMVAGRRVIIKDGGGNASTNDITIITEGSEKIDGADTVVIGMNYGSIALAVNSAATGWLVAASS